MIDLPRAYISKMQPLFGAEADAFFAASQDPPLSALRMNTLKVNPVDFSTLWKNQLDQKVPWCPSGALIHGDSNLGKHPYHAAGLYYLQEPSAMSAPEILAPQPGERVLDLAAAPGGKSTHLAALMQGQGLLVANEIHPKRAWELAENLERWGATHTIILNETPDRLAEHFGAFFDRVLVDAPCSGEGMFRKSEAARRDWSPALVQGCAARQADILRQAARLVRPGGCLVYSTCTFNPQENEQVILRFVDGSTYPQDESTHPQDQRAQSQISKFEILEIEPRPGFDHGRPEWAPGAPPELRRTVRIWPHRSPGEGHFVALLKKSETIAPSWTNGVRPRWSNLDKETYKLFTEFCRAALKISFDPERLALVGSYLYRLPEGSPDLAGLKVVHPGWWLGTFKKDRFEPAHALALGLRADDAHQYLDFQAEDPQLAAYLRGETLTSQGEAGWLLVCVDGFPLGWGKRGRIEVKNFYPRGLRFY